MPMIPVEFSAPAFLVRDAKFATARCRNCPPQRGSRYCGRSTNGEVAEPRKGRSCRPGQRGNRGFVIVGAIAGVSVFRHPFGPPDDFEFAPANRRGKLTDQAASQPAPRAR